MNGADITVQQCAACGHCMFPERYACSRCGSAELTAVHTSRGTAVDTVDVLRSPSGSADATLRIVEVALDAGPTLLARAAGTVEAGNRVVVSDDDGALTAKVDG